MTSGARLAPGLALLTLAAGLPLVCAPGGAAAFSVIKTDGFALVGVWALAYAWAGATPSLPRTLAGIPLTWPALGLAFLGAVELGARCALEGDARNRGADYLVAMLGPVLCLVVAGASRPGRVDRICAAFVGGSTIAALYGLLQFMGRDPFGWEQSFAGGAPTATLGNPLFLGSVAAAAGTIAFSKWVRSPVGKVRVWGAALFVVSAALFASQSRGAWAGGLGSLWLLTRDPAVRSAALRFPGRHRVILWIAACLGLAIAWSLPGPQNPPDARLFHHAGGVMRPAQWRGRLMLWEATSRIVRRDPVWGSGIGAVHREFPSEQGLLLSTPRYAGLPFRSTAHSHQDWLQWMVERGFVGMGLLAWALVSAAVACLRSVDPTRRAAGCAVAGWCVDAWVNGPLSVAPSAHLFWILLGIAGGRDGGAPSGPTSRLRLAFALLVALIAVRPFARDLAGDRYLAEGQRAVAAGQPKAALARLLAADALVREDRRQHFHLGGVWYSARRFEEAARAFALDVGRNPGMHSGWFNLGLALSAAGHAPEARAAWLRALALNPDDPETRRILGGGPPGGAPGGH